MTQHEWKHRLLRSLFLYILTPYLAVMAILFVFQRRLIFVPMKTGRLLAQDVPNSGSKIEDVEISAENGLVLHGWRFRADPDATSEPQFLVIYFSGNGGCRQNRLSDCRDFTHLGCDVLLFDYRGYGDNEGSPSEEHFAADARRIWKLATTEMHFPAERILLFGESMGGAVATRLASELSVEKTSPAALILNSAFATLAETAAWHYPFFPVGYLLWDRFPSVERIPHVACPILQFHGTADDIVPFEHGRRLFAATTASPAGIEPRFLTIEGGQHNYITVSMMQTEIRALLEMLEL